MISGLNYSFYLAWQEAAQSAAFSPDGSVVVVGCTTGHWLALDAQTREVVTTHTDGAEPIQVQILKFEISIDVFS